MRVCVKLTQLASLQKIIAYAIIIMAAQSGMDPMIVGFGCAFGIYLNEAADVWFKIIQNYETMLKMKKSAY